MSNVGTSLLIGLIGFMGPLDFVIGSNMLNRPIILGPLVGLVLGNLTQGIIIGASLELVFMGAISVGAYLPPDVIVGGVLGTAFAISLGKGVGAAIAIAMPIAMLSLAIGNLTSVIFPAIAHIGDRYAKQGKPGGITASLWGIGLIECTRRGILCFLGYFVGNAGMKTLLGMIPQNVIDGLQVAANMLPAIGFAILLQMIINDTVLPYFFLGFLLSAYLKVPVLGVALFGLIIVVVKLHNDKNKPAVSANGSVEEDIDDDDDF
ncbi:MULTISPECIES: PTS sugar transporter subunit IIC [unclassified Lactobacillus]|uniref:PTS mannose/fructose/sorbose/N-acetylgalactosamine transporter subunit IIC n=1 Tax=unclassified Lactobacillus TaxID=2620435 RepID=UPI0023F73BEE|nr:MULTISPECIES: PTS sugar transporter subunit IIC [unclassified Lactobacillus]WEV37410.1 PTS sugar transporter subunit IIC [Lactobacillus sp. ESL0677]WEV51539.1 PTS sugar transporter subunit IIC [Lactobacillus sp. ESL0700]WEV62667.1 PTS sugar transporter subunit IIC [Lactobacillus sp. ESL0731]